MANRIFYFIIFLSSTSHSLAQQPNLNLCFNEEFNSGAVNTAIWERTDWRNIWFCSAPFGSPCYIAQGCNTFNCYRTENEDNITFENETGTGNIVLTVKNELYPTTAIDKCGNDTDPINHTFNYTAPSYLSSYNQFKYGYFEFRCKLPQVSGLDNFGIGSNFWMIDWNETNGDYSELDVVEFICKDAFGTRSPNIYTSNMHFNSSHLNPNTHTSIDFIDNFLPIYHTFGVAWFPERYEFFIDGNLFNFYDLHSNDLNAMNIILDMNVFSYGEYIDSNTIMDYDLKVDYIKCYQGQDPNITYCDLSEFIPTLYQNLFIGNTNCSPTLVNNQITSFKATNQIIFHQGFTAETGSGFIAEILSQPVFICNQ